MRTTIRKHVKDFVAIVFLVLVSAFVATILLSNQRLKLPGWVPFVGQTFYHLKGEFTTAQAVTPGQGQSVDIAGVPVGLITDVKLKNGRAVVTMDIKQKYNEVYSNATMLLRPKTGLKDMVIELDPGTKKGGHLLKSGSTVPVGQTLPDVNLDEILAALDGNTRNYLQLLLHGAGEGLRYQGKNLRADFKRFDPVARDADKITKLLAVRRANIRRVVHNFGQVTGALANKDKDLASLVDSSNAVFGALADQDQNLRRTIAQLPPTLRTTNPALIKTSALARELGPALEALRPGARALAPAQRQLRPFLRVTTPIIRDQLRPFARQALPTLRLLRPAARSISSSTSDLVGVAGVVNYLFNELAYDPPGNGIGQQSYLFFSAWGSHAGDTVFSTQDAEGVVRRGQVILSCDTLAILRKFSGVPLVNAQISSLGPPAAGGAACPTPAATATGGAGSAAKPKAAK